MCWHLECTSYVCLALYPMIVETNTSKMLYKLWPDQVASKRTNQWVRCSIRFCHGEQMTWKLWKTIWNGLDGNECSVYRNATKQWITHSGVAPTMWTGPVQFQMSSLGTQRAHAGTYVSLFVVPSSVTIWDIRFRLDRCSAPKQQRKTANPTIYIGRAQARAVQAVKRRCDMTSSWLVVHENATHHTTSNTHSE